MEETRNKKDKPQKRNRMVRAVLFFLKVVVVVILLILFFWVGLRFYLESDRTKVFDEIGWLNGGSISFQKADFHILRNYPEVSFSLENLKVHDSGFDRHQTEVLQLGECSLTASILDLFDHQYTIDTVRMKNGSLRIFTDEKGYGNLSSMFEKEKKNAEEDGLKSNIDGLFLDLANVDFHLTEAQKNRSIKGRANALAATLKKRDGVLSAEVDFDLFMHELAFNKEKGVFVENSRLSGQTTLSKTSDALRISPFDLAINEEHFLASGHFDLSENKAYELNFANEQTHLAQAKPLLPEPIRDQLEPYQIAEPFFSKTKVKGQFGSGQSPLVTVDFILENNEVTAREFVFEKTGLTGRFVNRLYNDERPAEESRGRIRVELAEVDAVHGQFHIVSPRILITSTPQTGPMVQTEAQVKGKASGISDWLENDEFFFVGGRFSLQGKVAGPLLDVPKLLISSEADLQLDDFSVVYNPANVTFPFEQLLLRKMPGEAQFRLVSSTIGEGNNFNVDGILTNLNALLIDLPGERTESDIDFTAEEITWTDFLNLFGEHGYLKTDEPKGDSAKKKSMKETLQGIQYNFQPSLSVAVGALKYFDKLTVENLRTGVHFADANTLILEKSSFEYGVGKVNFSAKLDISTPGRTPFEFALRAEKLNLEKLLPPLGFFGIKLLANLDGLPDNVSLDVTHRGVIDDEKGLLPNTSTGEIIFKIDEGETLKGKVAYTSSPADGALVHDKKWVKTTVELEGMPRLFNKFFQTDRFFFDEGRFYASLDFQGNLASVEEILNEGAAFLTIENSEVYYKSADVTFPLTEVNLDLFQDEASFRVLVRSDTFHHEIRMDGKLENLSAVLLDGVDKQVHTTAEAYSPKLNWDQFIGLFTPQNAPAEDEPKAAKSMKKAIRGMMSTFDPDLHFRADTFVYGKKLMLEELETGIYLVDQKTLILENSGFRFRDGTVSMDGKIDLMKKGGSPFEANFNTEDLDAAALLESLNFLGFPSLQSLDTVAGRMTMNLDLSGEIAGDGSGLVHSATQGKLVFDLQNVIVSGLQPLEEMAAKLLMKDRFAMLRFAPLANEFTIQGKNMEIPLMEVQSNAINMFVEGVLSQGDETNLWVSIPLRNLKKRDLTIIPEKEGYAKTKRKVYVQVTSDENGENQFKLRLRKKKMYKEMGIPKQYRKDQKKYRKERKAMKGN